MRDHPGGPTNHHRPTMLPPLLLLPLAAEFGVSAERIRQIEQKAMQKMKAQLVVAI